MTIVTVVAAGVLAAVLPVSAFALYATLRRHTWLAPRSAMDAAAVERFDSEAERAAFHAGKDAAVRDHRDALRARYDQWLEARLKWIDPRRAEALRKVLAAAAGASGVTAPQPDPSSAAAAIEVPQPTQEPPAEPHAVAAQDAAPAPVSRSRPSWRERLGVRRGNGSSE